MILLSFTVRNHKSIRDEVTVDLTRPSLKTLLPKNGDWREVTYPLVGIFGANASGKSALLDALRYALTAVGQSATSWQAVKGMQRAPFLLDEESSTAPSRYELDVIHEERRYLYGFEVDRDGIKREWLRDVPTSRWRTLFERDRELGPPRFHQSLRIKMEVTPRELVLSRALLLPDSPLGALAQDLAGGFDAVLVKDSHREARLASIADSLAEGEIDFGDLEALLQSADIGVTQLGLQETNIPEPLAAALRRLRRELADAESDELGETDDGGRYELGEEEREMVVRHLVFQHRGTSKDCPPFSIQDESDGTIAWLATAVPALETLRRGGVLLVDEIDASLHPHLLEVLLGAFADPEINTRQAQLIFTSHESYVLSPLSEVRLEPEQVWLTDKTNEGVTELTCLADFPKHPDANVAKRYLTGRYGGTPHLSPSLFAALVESDKVPG